MSNVSEQVERLIVRRLDGELSAAEQLELDRELIRDPAARALFERYATIDVMAARVLSRCASPQLPRVALSPAIRPAGPGRDHARAWWMIAGSAMAACLAVVVLLKTPLVPQPTNGPVGTPQTNSAWGGGLGSTGGVGQPIPVLGPRGGDVGVWQVPQGGAAPQMDRSVNRNLIVVPGADGSYYLLNLDEVREVQRSTPRRVPPGDPI